MSDNDSNNDLAKLLQQIQSGRTENSNQNSQNNRVSNNISISSNTSHNTANQNNHNSATNNFLSSLIEAQNSPIITSNRKPDFEMASLSENPLLNLIQNISGNLAMGNDNDSHSKTMEITQNCQNNNGNNILKLLQKNASSPAQAKNLVNRPKIGNTSPLSRDIQNSPNPNPNLINPALLKEKPFRLGSSRSWNGTLYDYSEEELTRIKDLIGNTSQGVIGYEYHKKQQNKVLRIFCVFKQPWRPARLEKLGSSRAIWQHGRAKDATMYFKHSYKLQRTESGLFLNGPTNKDRFSGPVNRDGMGPNNKDFITKLYENKMICGHAPDTLDDFQDTSRFLNDGTNESKVAVNNNEMMISCNLGVGSPTTINESVSQDNNKSIMDSFMEMASGTGLSDRNSFENSASKSHTSLPASPKNQQNSSSSGLNSAETSENSPHAGLLEQKGKIFTYKLESAKFAAADPTGKVGIIKTLIPDEPLDTGNINIRIDRKETWDNRNLCRKERTGKHQKAAQINQAQEQLSNESNSANFDGLPILGGNPMPLSVNKGPDESDISELQQIIDQYQDQLPKAESGLIVVGFKVLILHVFPSFLSDLQPVF